MAITRLLSSRGIALVGLLVVAVLAGASSVRSPAHAARLPSETPSTRSGTSSAVAFPLKVGPTRRYLVDQRGVPFMIVGDSPQAMLTKLSLADAETFLTNRKAAGFNSIWVNLLCNDYTGCPADGGTYDGIVPFTTPGDLATPNAAYFARIDGMLALAAKYGFLVFLDPIETGGWLKILRENGAAKALAYGRFLGTRYKKFPNIIWFNGNDFQSWRNPADDAVVLAVARGIKAADPKKLQTLELNYSVSASLDDSRWKPLVQLDAAYTYDATYVELLKEYVKPDFLPIFMVEANYEFEHDYTGPETLRRQEYWSMLSGSTGQLYGNKYTWQFLPDWKQHLDTTGSRQMQYVTRLFAGRPWFKLVPDNDHTLVTSGYGRYHLAGVNTDRYATTARTPDGNLAISYLPSRRTITVDMAKLSGPVTAQWYDPTTGAYRPAGSHLRNKGSRQFTPPGANHDGDGDWALVLKAS
jgi:hypothetical protein